MFLCEKRFMEPKMRHGENKHLLIKSNASIDYQSTLVKKYV